MAASLKDIVESYEIGFYICIRIGDAVAYASLSGKIDNNLRLERSESVIYELAVCNVSLDKSETLITLKLRKALLLQRRIIIVIHIVNAHNLSIADARENRLHKIAAYESGSTGHKNPHII